MVFSLPSFRRTLFAVLLAPLTAAPLWAQSNPPAPGFLPEGRKHGFLGISTVERDDGCEVVAVTPNSPAWKMGIEVGDVVTAVDGLRVGMMDGNPYSVPSELRRSGGVIRLTLRDRNTGNEINRDVDVGGQALPKPNLGPRPFLGVSSVVENDGARAVRIIPNSPAEKANVRVGDLITHIDEHRLGIDEGRRYALPSEIRRSSGLITLRIVRDGEAFTRQIELIPGESLPPEGKTSKVHVLLIGLTDDRALGRAIGVNLSMMKSLVERDLPENRRHPVRILSGADCNRRRILQAVESINVETNESLLVYYAGHGAYDPNATSDDPSGGHFFQISSGDLLRKDLYQRMLAKRPRLLALITDTCNVRAVYIPQPRVEAPMEVPSPTLAKLLLEYRGFVDMSGSSRGQFGWYANSGIFTASLYKALRMEANDDWNKAFRSATEFTNMAYGALRSEALAHPSELRPEIKKGLENQREQTPQLFRFNVKRD